MYNDLERVKSWLSKHTCYAKCGLRNSRFGRCSGGLAVYVKNKSIVIKELKTESKLGIFLLLDRKFFGSDKDVLFCCVYIQPEYSNIYNLFAGDNGILMLQDMLVDIRTKHDCQIIIMGDMNSRTANLDDFIFDDNMKYIPVNFYENSDFALLRNNADKETNNFGHSVLKMCKHLDIHIVNGRSKSDQNGEFTYYGNDSCSTTDYALMSSELFSDDYDFIVKPLDEKCYDSDHLPIQLTIKNFRAQDVVTSRKEGSTKSYTKVCWNRNFRDEYLYHIRGRECMNMLNSASFSLDLNNIDKAVSDFESVLFKAAVSMIAKNVGNNIRGRAIPWWGSELSTLKQKRNKQLRIFRKHRLECQLNLYLALKKEFKILYRKKEFNYRKQRRDLLVKHKRGSN